MFKTWLLNEEKDSAINAVQTALDIIGFEPSLGTIADGANSLISILRAAAASEPDLRKKHLINAGISAISMVPFADLAKIFKYRPARKLVTIGARNLQDFAQKQKFDRRF